MSQELKKPIGNSTQKKHFVIAHNVHAGRSQKKVRTRIEDFFKKRGYSYEFIELENCNWQEIAAKAHSYDEVRFIAAGGDGTLRLVFQKLWEHKLLDMCPVAFLPLGSANVTALSFKLPFGLTQGLRRAVKGKAKPVDLGLVNNEHIFFIMVSFGTISRIVVETKRNTKKRFGVFAYLLSLPSLLAHAYETEKFEMATTHTLKEEMHSVIICNHLNIVGLSPARGIAPDDKNLHCITLHNKTPWGFLRGAHDFYLTTSDSKVLRHSRFQKESYTFNNFKGVVHIDGDTFSDLGATVEFSILPHAARLVV